MVNVHPSIRTAPGTVYAPRPVVRGANTRTTTASVTTLDFQSLLNKQPATEPAAPKATTPPLKTPPATTPPVATPPAATAPATATPVTTNPPSPSGTMGSIMLGAPGPVNNPVPIETVMAPTAQSLFGANPWNTNAGGSGPNGGYSYNKYYFATPETAAKVAQMIGGKVVETNSLTPYGPFVQNQANEMVQMPDGRLINAGIIASYYDRGWSQQSVDTFVKCETGGSAAVQT